MQTYARITETTLDSQMEIMQNRVATSNGSVNYQPPRTPILVSCFAGIHHHQIGTENATALTAVNTERPLNSTQASMAARDNVSNTIKNASADAHVNPDERLPRV